MLPIVSNGLQRLTVIGYGRSRTACVLLLVLGASAGSDHTNRDQGQCLETPPLRMIRNNVLQSLASAGFFFARHLRSKLAADLPQRPQRHLQPIPLIDTQHRPQRTGQDDLACLYRRTLGGQLAHQPQTGQ